MGKLIKEGIEKAIEEVRETREMLERPTDTKESDKLREKKIELERRLMKLLMEFEADSGMKIEDVLIERSVTGTWGSVIGAVTIKAVLD